jgi:hypothetical protein
MKKDSLIGFRASKELQESLFKVAKADRRSLSSMIEMILTNYLKDQKAAFGNDMRKHPRKPLAVPTVIKIQELEEIGIGSIIDISLSGVRISIPKDFEQNITMNTKGSKFELIFNFPTEKTPIKMTCESTRVVDDEKNILVGASFVDAAFNSYKSLHTYLM